MKIGAAPPAIVIGYALMSLLSAALYGFDKLAAQGDAPRTPESTLHVIDLIGGWPGGLIAQQLFRHKRNKPPFMVAFAGTVAPHLALWVFVAYQTRGL